MRHPEVAKRLRDMAAEPVGSSRAEQEAILKRQMDQFRPGSSNEIEDKEEEIMKYAIIRLLLVSRTALAQTFPTKPVRLIVTYPPGGSSDLMSRVYGAKLAELWGQQVIIESKPAPPAPIGMDFAAKQPNDGYTFVVGNLGPVAVNPLLSKVPYNIQKDFIAVSQISTGPERAGGAHRFAVQVAERHHLQNRIPAS